MSDETRAHMFAALWTWHAVFIGILALAVGRAAQRHSGSPFRRPATAGRFVALRPIHWPVSGRWLLAALFLAFSIMFCSVAWNAWQDVRENQITQTRLAFRLLPCFLEPWIVYRTLTGGLVTDPRRMEEPI